MLFRVFGLLSVPLTPRVGRHAASQSRLLCSPSVTDRLYASFSFFEFTPLEESSLDSIVDRAFQALSSVGARGTLYVAPEGYNGQFAVEADLLPVFSERLSAIDPVLGRVELNIGNVSTFSDTEFPFKKLLVKKRKFILTDSHDLRLDWADYGVEAPAEEYHRLLKSDDVVVLDCRNDYESELGRFEKAIPLNTSTFSESWVIYCNGVKLYKSLILYRRRWTISSRPFLRTRRF